MLLSNISVHLPCGSTFREFPLDPEGQSSAGITKAALWSVIHFKLAFLKLIALKLALKMKRNRLMVANPNSSYVLPEEYLSLGVKHLT